MIAETRTHPGRSTPATRWTRLPITDSPPVSETQSADRTERPTVQDARDPLAQGDRTEDELRAPDATVDWGDAVPPSAAATPVVVKKQRFRGFVRHRATQLVAAGVAGILIGGGTVALVEGGDGGHDRTGAAVGSDNTRGDRHGSSSRDGSNSDDSDGADGSNRHGNNNSGQDS